MRGRMKQKKNLEKKMIIANITFSEYLMMQINTKAIAFGYNHSMCALLRLATGTFELLKIVMKQAILVYLCNNWYFGYQKQRRKCVKYA